MSNIQMNILSCGNAVLNTGLPTCFFNPSNFAGAVLIPAGTTFTASELITFKTVLAAGIANDNLAERFFPIKTFEGLEDKSSEGVMEDTKYGGKRKVRDGKYAWYFDYTNGGTSLMKSLKSFDNQQDAYDVLFIDRVNNGLVGVTTGTDASLFGGFTLELLDVPNLKINDGSTSTKYSIGFNLENSDEVNMYITIVQFESSWSVLRNLSGLKNIEIGVYEGLGDGTAGTIKFKLTNGGTDLADYYSTELATASLYTATNTATGLGITVTSVTYVPATKTFDVLLAAADPDYPAVGGLATITIGEVSDLVTAGVVGYGNATITTSRIA
jgi:hypothetical protein